MWTPSATALLVNIAANSRGAILKEDYVQGELAAITAVPV